MAKIYEFPKIKKGSEKEETEVNENKLNNLLDLLGEQLAKMSDVEIINDPHYQRYRDEIQYYSHTEIIRKINTDDEAGVRGNPLFYSALVDVARSKGLISSSEN